MRVPGLVGRRLILFRLMSRISSEGISQSCAHRMVSDASTESREEPRTTCGNTVNMLTRTFKYLSLLPSDENCGGRSRRRLYPSASFSTSSRSSSMTSIETSAMRLWLKSTVSSLPVLDDLGGVVVSSLSEDVEPADLIRWCEGLLKRGMADLEAGSWDCESDMGFDAERRERM